MICCFLLTEEVHQPIFQPIEQQDFQVNSHSYPPAEKRTFLSKQPLFPVVSSVRILL